MKYIFLLRCLIACLIFHGSAFSDEAYPSKTVRLLVGFPAGTSADILARIYANQLSERLGFQFIVEDKAGASSNLAADVVAKSEPDGYTLLLGTVANSIGESYFKKLPFNFAKDFRPIAPMGFATNIVVASPTLGLNTVQDLIQYAKLHPDGLFYGTAGPGTSPHMSGELFNLMASTHLTHIPYKGNNQGLVDLVEGRLSVIFAPAPTVSALIKGGKVKPLAVTTLKRSTLFADVPTLNESGLKGFDSSLWYGLFAPKGVPERVVTLLAKEVSAASQNPQVKAQLATNGAEPMTMGVEAFAAFVQDDSSKWARVMNDAKIERE